MSQLLPWVNRQLIAAFEMTQTVNALPGYNMGIDLQRSYVIRRQSEPIGSLMPRP